MKQTKPLKRKTPLKRTGFKKPTILDMLYSKLKKDGKLSQLKKSKPLKRTKLKPVSKKRQAQNKEYSKLRKEFLALRPRCQVKWDDGCTHLATEVHHLDGREGDLLNDTERWVATCHHCHSPETGLHSNPNLARKLGVLT